MSEKRQSLPIVDSPSSISDGTASPDSCTTWTPEEEKALVRRLDLLVMPLHVLGFFALQLDRSNIANALTDNFFKDVSITQDQFNIGQQLLFAGIVLLELPSTLVLYRLGPSLWISILILAFGLVATFQAWQSSLPTYLATRLILGLMESGFIPAGLFSISLWYKKEELSKRFAMFFTGNILGQASSGLLAYGILKMRGVGGLTGWQWLFILEGLFTILVAGLFAAFFPGHPGKPKSLVGFSPFTDRELQIIRARVHEDGRSASNYAGRRMSVREVLGALSDWRIYPHLLLTFGSMIPVWTLWAYAPTLTNSFGYARLQSNALVSIGGWILVVVNLVGGFLADKFQRRGPVIMGLLVISWAAQLGNYILAVQPSPSQDSRFALLTVATGFANPWLSINASWLAINTPTPSARSLRMALYIMSSNAAGIIGSQIFRADDAPAYMRGWKVIVGLTSFGIVVCVFCLLGYVMGNRKSLASGGRKFWY